MPNLPCATLEDGPNRRCRDREKERRLRGAIGRMTSLHEGELGLVDVLACGEDAIFPLRALLFRRERSGIYQPRCRAALALGTFRAYNVLREFLAARPEITDPVERTGEDAVLNAAAKALASAREHSDFHLLLDVLRWRLLPGVIESLSAFRSAEIIPLLIAALAEDDCAQSAEAALNNCGGAAEDALVQCAAKTPSPAGLESETSRRQRRRALRLLFEIGVSARSWAQLRHLIDDPDPKIALLASKLGLSISQADKDHALERLLFLREYSDWIIAQDIEAFLGEQSGEIAGSLGKPERKRDTSIREGEKRILMRANCRGGLQ
jgi:hypothetical protein